MPLLVLSVLFALITGIIYAKAGFWPALVAGCVCAFIVLFTLFSKKLREIDRNNMEAQTPMGHN